MKKRRDDGGPEGMRIGKDVRPDDILIEAWKWRCNFARFAQQSNHDGEDAK